jgi:hypothetical protein
MNLARISLAILATRTSRLVCQGSFVIVACLFLALGVRASLDRQTELLEYANTHHDAGQVFAEITPVVAHRFSVRNRSGRTLKLVDQRCTCTCTTSQFSPATLEPGQSGMLDMSIQMPGGYSGKSSVRCELSFDDGSTRTCVISYESFPRMMVDLSYLDLGTFGPEPEQGDGSRQSRSALQSHISLFAPAGRPLPSLRSIRSPEEILTTLVGQPETSAVGGLWRRRFSVRFEANPAAMRKNSGATVTKPVDFVSDDGASAAIALTWRHLERYSVAPSPVFYGTVEADQPRGSR